MLLGGCQKAAWYYVALPGSKLAVLRAHFTDGKGGEPTWAATTTPHRKCTWARRWGAAAATEWEQPKEYTQAPKESGWSHNGCTPASTGGGGNVGALP